MTKEEPMIERLKLV